MSLVIPDNSMSTSSLDVSGIESPTSYPSSLIRCSRSTTLWNVSSPEAPPAFAVFGGYMYSSIATFLSQLAFFLSFAQFTARSATLPGRSSSGSAVYDPSGSFSVLPQATDIICPSNSGWAIS